MPGRRRCDDDGKNRAGATTGAAGQRRRRAEALHTDRLPENRLVRCGAGLWHDPQDGRGAGAQYGYACCAATETEKAARLCAASLRAAGQAACAAQIDGSANSARQSAAQALAEGRQVGIDASRAVACT